MPGRFKSLLSKRALTDPPPNRSLKRMARFHFLGTGEAFDSGWGNNSGLLHGSGIPTVLLDCGYQIPERLWRLRRIYPRLQAVVITHLHADHYFGLIPLLMRFWEEKRQEPLWIIGPRGIKKQVRDAFELGYPGVWRRLPYSVRFGEMTSRSRWKLGPLHFRFATTAHSVDNLAVRIEHPRWSLGISGDGQLTDSSRALYEGVDLLVHEVYSLRPMTPIHGDLEALSRYIAETPSIERIAVTHHQRNERDRIRKKVHGLARRDPRWIVPDPGLEISLP